MYNPRANGFSVLITKGKLNKINETWISLLHILMRKWEDFLLLQEQYYKLLFLTMEKCDARDLLRVRLSTLSLWRSGNDRKLRRKKKILPILHDENRQKSLIFDALFDLERKMTMMVIISESIIVGMFMRNIPWVTLLLIAYHFTISTLKSSLS